MATFSYNKHGTYVVVDGGLGKFDNDPATGVLSNGEEKSSFVSNDSVENSGSDGPPTSTFYGTADVGGVILIFTFANGTYFGWAEVDDPETTQLPELVLTAEISTGDFPACFLSGTAILTAEGPRPVESLSIGEAVLTKDGNRADVRWLGRQSVVTVFGPPDEQWPVLIRAGALAEGLPRADLRLTSDHAVELEGILIQAGALVNGASIRRLTKEELGDRYVVYHVETGRHDLILAEGLPVETFLDNVTRRRFDNYDEYVALYGAERPMLRELSLPRLKSVRQLPRSLRARLEERAALLGWVGSSVA